jgi:uncharacterized membrane protein YfcA
MLVFLGLGVGTIGTLIGAGGGFLLMPVLAMLYPKERPELLASISLAVVAFNALSGTAGYARMRRIDYRSGIWFGAAAIPGSIVGTMVTASLRRGAFDILLGSVLVVIGGVLLILGTRPEGTNGHAGGMSVPPPPKAQRLWLGVGISFGVGFLSSLLGIGGGIIHVPLLVHVLNFPVHVATATSHFVLAISAVTGTIAHLASGVFQHQGARRTVALAIGALIGAQIGARLSTRTPAAFIMRGLGLAMTLLGARIVWQGI